MLLEQLASLSDKWNTLKKSSCFCLKKLNHLSTGCLKINKTLNIANKNVDFNPIVAIFQIDTSDKQQLFVESPNAWKLKKIFFASQKIYIETKFKTLPVVSPLIGIIRGISLDTLMIPITGETDCRVLNFNF